MAGQLDGKAVLITGASAGVGRGVSKVLAERGADVVGMARGAEQGESLEKEFAELAGTFTFVRGDVTNPRDCADAVALTIDRHGRIDVLINNAGRMLPLKPIEALEDEDWNAVLQPTLTGVFNMTRAALPHMQARSEGHVINIASVGGVQAVANFAAYGAAKAAVINLTRYIAIENLERGVRSNALVLGTVAETGMFDDVMLELGRMANGPDWTPPPMTDDGTLAASIMKPEDVGRTIAMLCTDDAREINASTISMDRGITAGAMISTLMHMSAAGQLPA